ncbi:GNAT family N-acetyltransferase [Cobetia sp. 1AS1]|uniref:GNAT family N-acetyltransferase n=1 Tax=Cobetia sp. 1AS1 TaxID=3040016 RepID=UPI0024479130|nr:GNAT family N-acetyltransferase [Cobetia sp. 1AS1]MDH2295494.1 GNAT family N-acetyltransferase [Cobetia sp. 1AS1]
MNMPVDITSAASAEQSSSAASSHSAATPSQQLFGTTSLAAPATINLLSPAPGTRFTRRAVELEQAQARLRKPQDDSTSERAEFALRPLDLAADMAMVDEWTSGERASFWGMSDDLITTKYDFYQGLEESQHAQGWVGFYNDQPAFLVELYDPAHDPLGKHYSVQPGDFGMHFLVAPRSEDQAPISGFSRAVIESIMAMIFAGQFRDEHADEGKDAVRPVTRVVVEPDSRNRAIHPLNAAVGFVDHGPLDLDGKPARLCFCTPQDFRAALASRSPRLDSGVTANPAAASQHLTGPDWQQANRLLVRKALAEFSHERLIHPQCADDCGTRTACQSHDNWHHFRLPLAAQISDTPPVSRRAVEYRFVARRFQLDHWLIDAASIQRLDADGNALPLDARELILELNDVLEIPPRLLPVYLEEVSATLASSAWKMQRAVRENQSARVLAGASFQTLESAMSEGHPCFVANNGRMGFDALDYRAYAPEAAQPFSLVWIAVHRDNAHYSAVDGLDPRRLLEEELGEAELARLEQQLTEKGLAPSDYLMMPVHPWQWSHKLAITFAAEIASQHIVCLGLGEDRYQAQQSIRTLYNRNQPNRRYVKVALSILNMGFMRGLSPYYMRATPVINQWLQGLIDSDPSFEKWGFRLLREVAAIGYRDDVLEDADPAAVGYRKMLASLWRESPEDVKDEGERLMTMAALLHVDNDEKALLPALIERSGIGAEAWIDKWLTAYMTPLLHCYFKHDLVFMPHGENLIMRLRDGVPCGALMKDIAEEAALFATEETRALELPAGVERLVVEVPEPIRILSLLTDVFDCIFRFAVPLLVREQVMTEEAFWSRVAACIHDYQDAHPEMADKFARHDLFAPRFTLSCLNRLQLRNNQQMVDLTDPSGALQLKGELDNPIAAFARR